MNARHRKTLASVFAKPTLASIVFADIEALIRALGGTVAEREGSRLKLKLQAINCAAIDRIRAKRQSGTKWKRFENFSSLPE